MPQNNLFFPSHNSAGAGAPGYIDPQSAQWNAARHGKYYASTYGTPAVGTTAAKAGAAWRCSNTAGVTLSAALATTYVGICLSNPAGSGVNLSVKRVSGQIIVAPAAFLALGLISGWAAGGITAHTTPLTAIVNGYVGAAASSGSIVATASAAKVDSACTLVGTPAWDRWLAAEAVTATNPSFYVDLDDDIIVPPGGYVAVGANAAGPTAGFLGSFLWEEIAP